MSKSFSEAQALLEERELRVTGTRWTGKCTEEDVEAKVVVGTVPPADALLGPDSGVVLLLGSAPA